MANLLDLLNSDLGKTLISGTSKQIGADKGTTTSAISAALPLILGAMKNNAKTPEGASGLLNALNNEKHSGGILDNLGSILGGGGIDNDVLNDGAGILGHVFGGKEQNVAGAVSKSSGLDMGSAMSILKVAAPFLMGALGKQTRQQGVTSTNGLGDLLGGMLGKDDDPQQQSMITRLLDADGDGSVIDDVAGMILGSGKKGGGIGSILGGLFK